MQDQKDNQYVNQKNWVIVDNIPQLTQNKDYKMYATALEEAAQFFANNGSKQTPIVFIPHTTSKQKYSSTNKIDGCALIQFGDRRDALNFTKGYTQSPKLRPLNLVCYSYDDIQKYMSLPDQFVKSTKQQFQSERNLLWWLLDTDGGQSFRDQYVIRFQGTNFEETFVYWNDENEVKEGRKLCYDANDFKQDGHELTSQYVKWSPNGLYLLATFEQGLAIHGGPKWKRFHKLAHMRVDKMSFSPNEKFLISCNSASYPTGNNNKQMPMIKIWDVLTGALIKDVDYRTIGPAIKLRLPGWWPIFQWSADENYIAKVNSSKRMGAKPKDINKINIFHIRKKTQDELDDDDDDDDDVESSRFVIDKLGTRSITVDSLFDMKFSPTDNILSYTTVAFGANNSKIELIKIPSKNSLKTQALGFDVKKAHLHWQKGGKYLAVVMTMAPKKIITMIPSSNQKRPPTKHVSKEYCAKVGIMAVHLKGYPFSLTDNLGWIVNFEWEANGDRFGVIHKKKKRDYPDVSIYRIGTTFGNNNNNKQFEGSSRLIHTFEKRRCNELHWSPVGGRLVIANIDKDRRAGGELEFIDIGKITQMYGSYSKLNGPTVKETHEGITDISWDPSGRYLITATTQFLNSMSGTDTRYVVWSFQGTKLFQHNIKHFYQLFWRPRPSTIKSLILTKQDKQSAKSKLNNSGWRNTFRKYDQEIIGGVQSQVVKQNEEKRRKYYEYLDKIKNNSQNMIKKRNNLLTASNYKTNWTWTKIKHSITKSEQEWKINKDTMKKINAGDNVDFS